MLNFREANIDDLPFIIDLFRDDVLGSARESADFEQYRKAFLEIQKTDNNHVIVMTEGVM